MTRYQKLKMEQQSKNDKTSTPARTSRYQQLKKQFSGIEISQDYISNFIADSDRFISANASKLNDQKWAPKTSEEGLAQRNATLLDLAERGSRIKAYLNANADKLDANERDQLLDYIERTKTYRGQISDALDQMDSYFSKWETEEDYNTAVKQWQEYYDAWGHYADEADFEEYAGKGATIQNPTFLSAQGMGIGPWRFGSEDIGNIVTFSRDNYNDIVGYSEGGKYDVVGNLLYKNMTDDEVNLYNYLLAKEGKEAADSYLSYLEPQLKQTEGRRIGNLITGIDVPVLEDVAVLGYGFGAGVDQWASGTRQFFTNEKLSPSITQHANAYISESLDGFGSYAHQTATTIGNMAPSILVSYFTGGLGAPAAVAQGLGAATVGVSAAGNAYSDALSKGYDKESARTYSTLVGAAEGVLQYIIGGVSSLGGMSRKLASKIAAIDNSLLRISAKMGASIGSEIFEEELQNFLEPAFRTWIFGEEYDMPTPDELIETAIVTAMSTGLLEGGGTIGGDIQNSKYYKSTYGNYVQDLVLQGLESAEGTLSHDLAAKYQAKLDAGKTLNGHQMGRMVEANEQQFRTEDLSNIQSAAESRLTELGETGDVKAIAAALTKQAVREKLSRAEQKAVANSKYGQRVANELNTENIQSGNYSNEWAQKLDTQRINVDEYSRLVEAAQLPQETAETAGENVGKYKSLEKRMDGETSAKVSKTGKAVIRATNEEIDLSNPKIKSITEDSVVLDVHGKDVDTEDIDFATDEQRIAFNALKKIEHITPGAASAMIAKVDFTNPVWGQLNGMDEAFSYGYYHYSEADLKAGNFTGNLTQEQLNDAYKLGQYVAANSNADKANAYKAMRTAAQAEAEKAVAEGKEAPKAKNLTISYSEGGGKVVSIDKAGIKDAKRSGAVEVAKILHKIGLGTRVEFFSSYIAKDENGNKVRVFLDDNGVEQKAYSGVYRKSDGTIRIDLNAYNGKGLTLNALAHELTHFIQQWSDEKYKVLADFLVKSYEQTDMTMNERVIREQARLKRVRGEEVSYNEAFDEVVANAMMKMFDDGKLVERLTELKSQDESLARKLWEGFKKILAKFIGIYENAGPLFKDTADIMAMKDTFEQLQNMFAEALVDASGNYQASQQIGLEIDVQTESVSPAVMHSEHTWTESDYVQERDKAAKEIAKAIGVSVKKAKNYIDAINSIAKMIAEDRSRLDYFSSPGRTSFVGNVEYGGSFDFSTLCKKRRLLTGTFTAIQNALPNTALTADEILDIRNRMKKANLEVSCGLCYVEGSRANMVQFAKEFLRLYKQYYPDAWQPNMADVNTPDGIEWVRINHPECYEQYEYFWNHYGTLKEGDKNLFASQQKPKLYQLHTEYKGEILQKFKGDENVEEKNLNGGIRLQSFSDFEIVHLIDTMQIIMDMSRVGLAGQAYTKVPDFAWALGDTGLKINLSLIAKGVDADGKLIFDDVEGMPIAEAMKLRDRYSKNVGTILVAFNDEQLLAAMADDRVDFIIPFHRSQWKKSQYEAMGLPAKTKDYTYMQNEKFIKPQFHEYRGRMVKDKATNYMPNEYWDFSKSGKENAEAYLEMCARNNKRPKFYKLLQNNGDGSYSLKADGTTDGYWKLLIDFKMYDNKGNGSPQMAVKPEFNMEEANRMLNDYAGGHSNFPVAQGIVDSFVKEYKSSHKGEQYSSQETDADKKRKTEHSSDSPLTRRSVKQRSVGSTHIMMPSTAAARILGIENISNYSESVNKAIAVLGELYVSVDKKKPVLGFRRPVSASSLEGALVALGVLKREGSSGSAYRYDDGHALRISDHSANANNFIGDGEHLSVALFERGKMNDFVEGNSNVIEAVFRKRYLDNNPDALKQLIHDIAHFIAEGEYHDTAGAMRYNFSGTEAFKEQAQQRMAMDETVRKQPKTTGEVYSSQQTDADNAPIFYSKMGKVVEGMKQEKFSASSVISMLRGRGVKAEEIRWSGIQAFLDGKKSVTKQELLDFINGSMLHIEEETRGSIDNTQKEFIQAWRAFIDQDLDDSEILDGLDYVDTSLPYHLEELVENEDLDQYYADYILELAKKANRQTGEPTKWDEYKLDGGENYRELIFKMPGSTYSNDAMKTHWGDDAKGVLAHARVQDFDTPYRKILFIEEIQSDWHNESRKNQNTPDAPFNETYHEYVLKRLLRMAAEEGYDSIGWTTADIQMHRWNMLRATNAELGIKDAKNPDAVAFEEGYRIEYDQKMRKFMEKYGKQWGATVEKTDIQTKQLSKKQEADIRRVASILEDGEGYIREEKGIIEIWSMDITDAMKKSVMTEGQEMYSEHDTDFSNRSLLANAFETITNGSEEYKLVQRYKGYIAELNSLENKLDEFNRQIREIRFGTDGNYDAEKLKKLESEAKKIADAINKYDQYLLALEASAPLRKVIERERKKEAKKTKDHVKEIQQNKKLRAEQTELRHKIRKVVRDLDKILNRGNKKQNVKEDMKGFVSKALDLADYLFTDHITNDDLIRRGITVPMRGNEVQLVKETEAILTQLYDNADSLTDEEFTRLDAKRKANEDKLRDLLTAQRNERLNTSVYNLFNDLLTEYASLKNSKQDAVRAAYNVDLERLLRSFMGDNDGDTDTDRKTVLQNMRVADMTTAELEKLYKAYKMVLTNIRDANKVFVKGKLESIDKAAEKITWDFSKRKAPDKKVAIIARNLANKMGWDYEKLYYALDRIGSETFTELVMNIANSENIVMQDVMEAAAFRDKMVKDYGYNNWDVNKEIDREFLDNTGKKFKLTLGQLMALYAYSRREGAWDHIEYGGFVFGEAALTNPRPADSYKLTKDQCEVITNLLTKEQKGYAEAMQKYLSETMGEKGNKVSMLLYGIKMFGEKNYFPIHIAGQFKAQAQESQAKAAAGFSSMSNAGFTHAQNPNAKAPFVLEGFNEIWADHVNEMSRYHGTVPALEDMRRVMNRSSYSESGMDSMAIKQLMENSYGKEAVEYFDNLYREANSGAITDKLQKASKKLLSLFRKNSVAYSLSVLVQQPASLVRAYAMIPKKYFGFKGFGTISSGVAKAVSDKWTKAHTNAYNEMLKYAPGVTMAKEIGGFDTATGGSIRSYLLDTGKSLKQKWKTGTVAEKGKAVLDVVDDNAIANLPNLADKIAWIEIWNACKRETIAKHKDLVPTSDEFMQIVGDRFTEVIRATQVYDSIFAKSPMLKSKNLAVQYLVSFMNEPNTVANMAESAVRDAIRGDWKRGAKKAHVLIHSIIFTAALKSIIYAMRDDDEDETYIEKYIEVLTGSLMDDFWALNYIPIARDVWSIAQGYDVERADMAMVSDVIGALNNVFKNAATDTEGMTEEQLIEFDKKVTETSWQLVEALASAFGIPVRNIRREINGVIDHARIAHANAGKTTANSAWDKIYDGVIGSIPFMSTPSKQDKLYDAIISGDTEYVDRLKGGYKTESAYHSAMREAIKGHFESGEIDTDTAEQYLIDYCGTEEDDAYWKVREWEHKALTGEDFAKYDKFYTAVQTGKDLKATIKEYTDNGATKEALASQITSHFKPLYKKMSNTGRASIKGYLLNAYAVLGYDRTKKSKDIDKWVED